LEPLYDSEDEMIIDLDALQKLAFQRPTPLRLADMYKYAVMKDQGQRLRNAQFLHKELPIRIAQRAYDLLTLPRGLNQSKPIRSVAYIYLRYLKLFEDNPSPKTLQEEEAFTQMLTSIMLDRTTIPKDIARGIQLWRQQQQQQEQQIDIEQDQQSLQDMEDALYRFFTARVGLRFLTEHHILSSTNLTVQRQTLLKNDHWFLQSSQQQQQQEDCSSNLVNSHLGCIQTDCNPVEQIQLVANRITEQAMAKYGVCPQIKIISSAEKHRFTYVPHHLQYMVAELLKNSCHATIRNSTKKGLSTSNQLQPIRIVIVLGAEDVSIKIADRGGGVPRSTMKKIFQFTHSTKPEDDEDDYVIHENNNIDGNDIRGFGLPLCRIYARYFGGELTLKSMEGYGLDAYLHLPRLGDACENLPRTVMSSPGGQVSMPTVG
jgi:pyruvate dehydrogenase kinase 2/3/4